MTRNSLPWHIVKKSTLHGTGVFAARNIPAGTRIIEYGGKRITSEQADAMHPVNPDDPFHTFFFSLSSGEIIDGGDHGTDARWINHSCSPNCEAQENRSGKKVYIHALEDIPAGTELFYDYGLVMEGRITRKLKEQYRCLCGTAACRGTMLALPEKAAAGKRVKRAKDKEQKGAKRGEDKVGRKGKASGKTEAGAGTKADGKKTKANGDKKGKRGDSKRGSGGQPPAERRGEGKRERNGARKRQGTPDVS